MRSALVIGLAAGAVALCGGGLFLLLHHGDPLATGRSLMDKGDMHRASLYLREAVRQHPDNPEAAYRLGVTDLALGNPAAAELELKRARAHGYDPHKILMPLGQAYLQQHHYDQLLHDFDVATAPAWAAGGTDALRASAELALGNLQAAQQDAAAGVAAAPDEPAPQIAAARVALARNDTGAASTILDRVLKADPTEADALLLRAGIAIGQGHAQDALADSDKVLAGNPRRIDAKLMRARSLAILGREKEARAIVDDVVHSAHRDPAANYLRMVLAVRAHDWQAANESLEVISPIIGNLPRGLFYVGLIKMNVGQPAQAEDAVTKFLGAHPDDIPARKLMAFIALTRHRSAEARAQLQDIVASGHADADALDLMGRAQAMSGDTKAAESTFSEAQKLAPDDENILNRLAGVRLALGETAAADQDLRRSLAVDPRQSKAGETLVRGLLERGDIAGAKNALASLKQAVGETAVTATLQAEIQLAELDLPSAQRTLQAALKQFPDSEQIALLLVRVDGQLGAADQAEPLLAGLLHRKPADEAALQLELSLLLAQGKTDAAARFAEAAHEAAAGNAAITAALAAIYLRMHDPDRAIGLLDRVAAVSQDPALTILRARILAAMKRDDAARNAYRDVIEGSQANPEARRELAMLQISERDFNGARATLRDGLHASPGNALLMGSLVGLELKAGGTAAALHAAAELAADPANLPAARLLPGDIWAATGDQAHAADAYLAAFKAAPSETLAVHAADALAHSGRVPQAETLLRGWLAGHPDDVATLSVLSSLELQQQQLPEAKAQLQHLVELRPTDAAALNNLAWLLAKAGDHDAALSLARRAYYIAPQPHTADTLGWIMARGGDTSDALPLLQKASASGHAPDQLYHYAAVLVQTGDKARAKPILQQALAQKTAFDERPDAQKLLDSLK